LRADQAANLDVLAPECQVFGVAGLESVADLRRCILQQHTCKAEETLRREAPRAEEILAAVGRDLHSNFCPTPEATPTASATPTRTVTPVVASTATVSRTPTPAVTPSPSTTPTAASATATIPATPTVSETPPSTSAASPTASAAPQA
jgi:hypothetical protein